MKKILISFVWLTTSALAASLNQVSQKEYVLPESIVSLISGDLDPRSPLFCAENVYYQAPSYKLKLYNYTNLEIEKIFTEVKKRLPYSDDLAFYIAMLKVLDFLEFKQQDPLLHRYQKVDLNVIVNYISDFFRSSVDHQKKDFNYLKVSDRFWFE